ncbi:MAG: hypothetical protein HY660_06290 [Armatimonadetes bacterium]|nr:hypothetical protein [Armatimonadota bacterium]
MRHLALIALLTVSLAAPGFAGHIGPAVPYSLTLSGSTSGGGIAGKFGGVTVGGAYMGGEWVLTVYGKPFVKGIISCTAGPCTLSGTMVAGKIVTFFATGRVPGTVSGRLIVREFPNHDAWTLAVDQWARSNMLTSEQYSELIYAATRF